MSGDSVGSGPRVLLAGQDRLLLEILALACDKRGIVVTGETESLAHVVSRCDQGPVDVLVTADCLDEGPVDSRLGEILDTGTRVVVLSADPSPERVTAALSLGVAGYLYHDSSPDEVAGAILVVARGAAALSPTVAAIVLQQWRRLRASSGPEIARPGPTLTSRESEVLAAMADGLSAKAVGKKLGVAVKTVENHKIRIFEKLQVHTQAHAVSVAVSHGLLATGPDIFEDARPAD